mmetsp:Transcript_38663/g.80314  ORF Transcript_38663/g.80314 Transcript_38663/m.80314 type:complete len:408 (-) Transcript_38663:883-2106(-)
MFATFLRQLILNRSIHRIEFRSFSVDTKTLLGVLDSTKAQNLNHLIFRECYYRGDNEIKCDLIRALFASKIASFSVLGCTIRNRRVLSCSWYRWDVDMPPWIQFLASEQNEANAFSTVQLDRPDFSSSTDFPTFFNIILNFPRLTTLELSRCQGASAVAIDCLKAVAHCTNLKNFELKENAFKGTCVESALLQALIPLKLQRLSISASAVDTSSTQTISKLLRLNNTMEYLSICNCSISDDFAAVIFEALTANTSLKELKLGGLFRRSISHLGDNQSISSSEMWMGFLPRIKCLKHLTLPRGNFLEQTEQPLLEKIRQNLSLESLQLFYGRHRLEEFLPIFARNMINKDVIAGIYDNVPLPIWPHLLLALCKNRGGDSGTVPFTFLQRNISHLPLSEPNRKRTGPLP